MFLKLLVQVCVPEDQVCQVCHQVCHQQFVLYALVQMVVSIYDGYSSRIKVAALIRTDPHL
jgi:hypothetical protein